MIIDTYEPKDWLWLPKIQGGNCNGFLYDWPDGEEEFHFIDEFNQPLVARNLGDGQVEVENENK